MKPHVLQSRHATGDHYDKQKKPVAKRQICFVWYVVINIEHKQYIGMKSTLWDMIVAHAYTPNRNVVL